MSVEKYYDPYLYRSVANPMTNAEALVGLLKCSIGTGVLAMPMAFRNVGWVNGFLGTFLVGALIVYALHILLHNMYELCKRQRVPQLTYPETMTFALSEGPPFLQVFRTASGHKPSHKLDGTAANLHFMLSIVVDIFLALCHFGVCCVYVVFIADHIKQVVDYYFFVIDNRFYMCALILPLILIFSIRKLKTLLPFLAVSNCLLLTGFAVVLYYIFIALPPFGELKKFQQFDNYPLFFGTIIFAIESVGMIITIEAHMAKPKDFLGLTGILNRGMFLVIILYATIGFFGYWRYGDEVENSITLNLPETDILPQIVSIMFAIAIFFSYAMQGFVTIDVIWHHCIVFIIDEDEWSQLEYLLRVAIVLASVMCAISFPNFGTLLSLVGFFCLSILGIVFPALVDICVKYTSGYGYMKILLIKDIFLMLFGFICSILGTRAILKQIMAEEEQPLPQE